MVFMCLETNKEIPMNLKKVIKYSALGLVAVLATSALVACSSGKSASGKKPLKLGLFGTANHSLTKKKTVS